MMNRSHLESLLKDVRRDRAACQSRIAGHEEAIAIERTEDHRLGQIEEYVLAKLGAGNDLPAERDDEEVPAVPAESPSDALTLEGMTQVDAAAAIMAKANRPMRINEIIDNLNAVEGFERKGYERSVMYNSLYTTMKKSKDRFRRIDSSLWALADSGQGGGAQPRAKAVSANGTGVPSVVGSHIPTYVDAAEIFARRKGGLFRLTEVTDWLIEQGYKRPKTKQNVTSSLYNAILKSPKFRQVNPREWELVSDDERSGMKGRVDRVHGSE
jgi:hypothetical protein